MDVLFISPEQFKRSPQVGTPRKMDHAQLADHLSRPSVGEAKGDAGGISPALYEGNVRRKSALVWIWQLVLDFDDVGDVDQVADELERYSAIVHETFSSTNDQPRCRAYIEMLEPVDASEYEAMHQIARRHMATAGLPADEGAKDASRLSYAPVRRPGAGYRFRVVEGEPLDVRAVLTAQPAPKPRPRIAPPSPSHADAYARGALRRAADAVAAASDGRRHYQLCREAFTLSRLEGLTFEDIERALLAAFISAAGERRQLEGERTIRDAVRAKRGPL